MSLTESATSFSASWNAPALPTTFSPARTCFKPTLTLTPGESDPVIGPFSTLEDLSAGCYPPSFSVSATWVPRLSGSSSYSSAMMIETTYSPATCPSGFQNMLQSVDGSTTSAMCCPSGMSTEDMYGCSSVVWSTAMVYTGPTSRKLSTVVYAKIAYAYRINVQWQSKDMSLFSLSATTSATPSPTPNPTRKPHLSDSAWAGIGTGIAVAWVLVVGTIAFWARRRKRASRTNNIDPLSKAELPGEGPEKPKPHFDELGDDDVHEATGEDKPQEMQTMDVPAELEGNWHGHEAGTETAKSHGHLTLED